MTTPAQKAFEEWAQSQRWFADETLGEFAPRIWHAALATVPSLLAGDDVVEAVAKAIYNSYWQGNDKWPDATTNERAMNIDMAKAALAAAVRIMGGAYGVGSKDARTTPGVCAPSPANNEGE